MNMFLSSLFNESINNSDISAKKIENYANNNADIIINGKKYNRLLVMGDIHGCFDKAKATLTNANMSNKDFLICLGDYTDRGPKNLECMKLVIKLNTLNNVITLLGNHEWMLLHYFVQAAQLITGKDYIPSDLKNIPNSTFKKIVHFMKNENIDSGIYFYNGGKQTLDDITDDSLDIFKEYLQVIYDLNIKYELNINNKHYFFAHAGIDPSVSFEEQELENLIWIREKFFNNYHGNNVIVVGHTPSLSLFQDVNPHFKNNILFLDTTSFHPLGRITIMDILNNQYWQNI